MSDIIIVPNLGNVGLNPCYQTEQSRYLDFMTKTVWKLPLEQQTGVWVSDVAPTDESQIWVKVNPSTGAIATPGGVYRFVGGQWVGTNPVEPLTPYRALFAGTEQEVWSHDGGDGSDPAVSTPTPSTGAMWEVDTDFSDMVLGGVGLTIPRATNTALFATGTDTPSIRGIYVIKRTARLYYVP
jgi:hypothetical protein